MSGAATPTVKIGADEDQFESLKNDLLLRAARGDRVERPPMWIMRQAGRYLPEYGEVKGDNDFFDVCRDPELASTITIQPIDRYAGLIDAAIIFSDILVVPQAMGMEVEMLEAKGPSFTSPLLDSTPKDELYRKLVAEHVDIPGLVEKELQYVMDAITLTRKKLAGRVPLIGFVGAPWTLFTYMVEGAGSKTYRFAKSWIFKYPLQSKRLLQRISEVCVEFLARQVLAGAQVVQVFDSHAGELSPNDFGNFSLPYLKYIATHLPLRLHHLASHKYPERTGYNKHVYPPMIVFAKGAWYALDTLCSSGYNVVSLDWTHDPNESVKVADGRVVLQGNLDPGVLYGGKDAIIRESRRMVEGFWGAEIGCGKKSGWIVNLGHGITPNVDPEDLRTFLTDVKRHCLEITGEASR